ncbi:MAG: NifB/NifX family molybdenum-iron cluster-binding protein [Candidatus Omnitrophota bacterium]|jgi:predicted Fe-Mo cluster-binding NifX family protein
MKICIPTVDKNGLEATVCEHFGSAPYFTVCDTENGTVNTIENKNAHHSHGMCHPIGALGNLSIDAVVCSGMGMRAVEQLNRGGIKAFLALGGTVSGVVNKYKTGELKEITAENACRMHGCH